METLYWRGNAEGGCHCEERSDEAISRRPCLADRDCFVGPPGLLAMTIGGLRRSEKYADVFRGQHILVEHQPAAGDLPGAGDAAQHVLAAADIEILLRLAAA